MTYITTSGGANPPSDYRDGGLFEFYGSINSTNPGNEVLDVYSALYNADAASAELNNATFSAGGKPVAITGSADQGGGTVRFTTAAAHGLVVGEPAQIDDDFYYSGAIRVVTAVPDTTHFELPNMYATTYFGITAGNLRLPDRLKIAVAGKYLISLSTCIQAGGAGSVEILIVKNATIIAEVRLQQANVGERVVGAISRPTTLAANDWLYLVVQGGNDYGWPDCILSAAVLSS